MQKMMNAKFRVVFSGAVGRTGEEERGRNPQGVSTVPVPFLLKVM